MRAVTHSFPSCFCLLLFAILEGCISTNQRPDLLPIDSSTFLISYMRNGPLKDADTAVPPAEIEKVQDYVSYQCAKIAQQEGFQGFMILHSHQTLAANTSRDRPFSDSCGSFMPHKYGPRSCQGPSYMVRQQVLFRLLNEDDQASVAGPIINSAQELVRLAPKFPTVGGSTLAPHPRPVSYGPKKDAGSGFQGYSELRLSDDSFKVAYEGGHGSLTELRLYYRAAQLTLQAGFDYFVLSEYQSPSVVRLTWQRTVNRIGQTIRSFDDKLGREGLSLPNLATIIEMHKGERPLGRPAFDAKDVIQTVTPLLIFE